MQDLGRRQTLGLIGASAVAAATPALSGCVQNEALGRSQLILVSEQELESMGRTAWRQALTEQKRTSDRGLNRKLEGVGSKIASSAGLGNMNWEFAVFDNDTPNAWVMPGGKVGFHSGIFPLFDNDAQLATVMGHECGHVAGRHSAERVSQQMAAQLAAGITGAVLATQLDRKWQPLIGAALGAGVTFGFLLPYSRQHEYEADRLGLQFMAGAGYDPREAQDFWVSMSKESKGGKPLEFMSTHPSDENRISEINKLTPSLLPVYQRNRSAA